MVRLPLRPDRGCILTSLHSSHKSASPGDGTLDLDALYGIPRAQCSGILGAQILPVEEFLDGVPPSSGCSRHEARRDDSMRLPLISPSFAPPASISRRPSFFLFVLFDQQASTGVLVFGGQGKDTSASIWSIVSRTGFRYPLYRA